KFLLSGGDKAMVSMQGGHFVPVPFTELLDPKTGRARVRLVDIHSDRYAIARRYMIRLRRDDFDDAALLGKIAATIKMGPEELRRQFEYLVEKEPPPLKLATQERSRACTKSSTRSWPFSIPTDRRMKPSSMPSLRRVSGGTEACVMIAGCSIRLSTPPSDSATVNSRSALRKVRAAGSPPLITQVSIPPKPVICL